MAGNVAAHFPNGGFRAMADELGLPHGRVEFEERRVGGDDRDRAGAGVVASADRSESAVDGASGDARSAAGSVRAAVTEGCGWVGNSHGLQRRGG